MGKYPERDSNIHDGDTDLVTLMAKMISGQVSEPIFVLETERL